jgi:putative transcriptional regulator
MTSPAPVHHVPDEDLIEYAAGACGEAAALAIACHVALCAGCADRLLALEAMGGAALDAAAPQDVAPGALETLLANLDAPPPQPTSPDPEAVRLLTPHGIPRLVLPYLAPGAAAAGWRRLVPGISRLELSVGPRATVARLVRLQPGLEIPLHDHGGTEYTVIFTGALADDQGRFARGDISIRDSGERHVQHVETVEPCIALVINEGPLVPLTLKGKLLTILSGG